MMIKLLLSLCILVSLFVNSNAYSKCNDKPVVIAVIDTGFGFQNRGKGAKLCQYGHKDFTLDKDFHHDVNYGTKDPIPSDYNGHGTNIVGVIEEHARKANVNYCIVIMKYYSPSGSGNIESTIKAINYATDIKVDYINYSSGGVDPSSKEKEAIERFLDGGGKFIAAAGNNNANLDLQGNTYYPAMYDKRIIVVGSTDKEGNKLASSNYGSIVTRWEVGLEIVGYGLIASGTSQATANATGKIVSENPNKCDIGKQ